MILSLGLNYYVIVKSTMNTVWKRLLLSLASEVWPVKISFNNLIY